MTHSATHLNNQKKLVPNFDNPTVFRSVFDISSSHNKSCYQVNTIMSFSRIHIMITYLLIVSIPYAVSITFNLTNIGPQNLNREIEVNGSYVSDGGIQVTPNEIGSDRSQKAGQAIYFEQLRLWDKSNGDLASFATNFTFVIDSNGNSRYGDGLVFFLAEKNSVITKGGAMGLPVDPNTINATNRFVAVEFDTFYNTWDPLPPYTSPVGDHVGISISSLTSVRTQSWLSNITGGGECQAWITYDSASKNFSVSFTGYRNNTVVRQDELVYTVDLRNELPEWVIFGFSAATGERFQRNNVISWSFHSTDLQNAKAKIRKAGLVIGLVAGISFTGLFLFVLWRWKMKSREDEADDVGFLVEMNNEFEMGTGPKRFSYNELARSTSYFSESEKLGEGGFGGVYRGVLKDLSTNVAVKKVSKTSKQGIKEYASEVRIISRLRHRNLVQLIGWCHEKRELLLVYEYMENGSLDSHLFKARSVLPWDIRHKIVHGVASALLYLHEEWEQCVLHRDIKSSNVMLDSNFNAKLGDFGLAKLVDHEKGSQTTMMAGTLGYIAPECVVTGKASKESDVFSFGVVALEIACGRKPIDYKAPEKQIRLVEWVWELYGSEILLEAADPLLRSEFDEDEIQRLMIVGLWCAHPDSESRPSMRQALEVLKSEASLPVLPSNMPVASYLTPAAMSPVFVVSNEDLSRKKTLSIDSSYLDGR